MNCEICKKQIATTFLSKILGTYVRDQNGKRHAVCFECQKKLKTKKETMEKLAGR